MEFDLESAKLGLEQVSNLLAIYREFLCYECPEAGSCTDDEKNAAFVFVLHSRPFFSIIDAAQDKIAAMCKEITFALKKDYEEGKKRGEPA